MIYRDYILYFLPKKATTLIVCISNKATKYWGPYHNRCGYNTDRSYNQQVFSAKQFRQPPPPPQKKNTPPGKKKKDFFLIHLQKNP